MKINRKKRNGFSLVELLIAVVLVGILATGVVMVTSKLGSTAKDNVKKSNAETINRIISTVGAVGGSIGQGSDNDIDTTNIETVVHSLSKEKSLTVQGIQFVLEPKPNHKSYELMSDTGNYKVKPILGTKESP